MASKKKGGVPGSGGGGEEASGPVPGCCSTRTPGCSRGSIQSTCSGTLAAVCPSCSNGGARGVGGGAGSVPSDLRGSHRVRVRENGFFLRNRQMVSMDVPPGRGFPFCHVSHVEPYLSILPYVLLGGQCGGGAAATRSPGLSPGDDHEHEHGMRQSSASPHSSSPPSSGVFSPRRRPRNPLPPGSAQPCSSTTEPSRVLCHPNSGMAEGEECAHPASCFPPPARQPLAFEHPWVDDLSFRKPAKLGFSDRQ